MKDTAAIPLLIVVPTLNSYVILPRLLNSLQQQTWHEWRLLFVDGNSSVAHRDWLQACCEHEPRCQWIIQDQAKPGIFGAMNQGFEFASASPSMVEWLVFWGSDDWASSPSVFADVMASVDTFNISPDLLVFKGRYYNALSGLMSRSTFFHSSGILSRTSYRRLLLLGSTPPHQATLFGTGARKSLSHYCQRYSLSADLDYFLRLSSSPGMMIGCIDLEIVNIGDNGISSVLTLQRLSEVACIYRQAFGWNWCFPFLVRYFKRLLSLISAR